MTNLDTKYLDENLRPVLKPARARFYELDEDPKQKLLRLYSLDIYNDVDALYEGKEGSGPQWKKSITYLHGKWQEIPDKEGILFLKDGKGWTAKIGKQSVTILPDCDPRDAATWIKDFLRIHTTRSNEKLGQIQLLENARFVLGGTEDDGFTALAAARDNEIQFFNHKDRRRLFSTATESVTKNKDKPTSNLNILAHEAAHLFRKQLEPFIENVARIAYDAFTGNEAAKLILTKLATDIHEDYLIQVCRATSQKAASLASVTGRYDLKSDAPTPLKLASVAAEEIVVEAFARYVLLQEPWGTGNSTESSSLLEGLLTITLQPTILPSSERRPYDQKFAVPYQTSPIAGNKDDHEPVM